MLLCFFLHPPPTAPSSAELLSHACVLSLFLSKYSWCSSLAFWRSFTCVRSPIYTRGLTFWRPLPASQRGTDSQLQKTNRGPGTSTWGGRERQRNGGRSRDEEASYSEDQRGVVVVVVMGVRDGDAAAEHDSGAGAHDGDAAHLQAGPQRRHAPLRLPRLLLQPHCHGHRRAPCPHLRKVRTPLSFTAYVLLNCSISSPLLQCFLFQYCCGWSMITYAWLTLHSCATGYYFKKRATCFFLLWRFESFRMPRWRTFLDNSSNVYFLSSFQPLLSSCTHHM